MSNSISQFYDEEIQNCISHLRQVGMNCGQIVDTLADKIGIMGVSQEMNTQPGLDLLFQTQKIVAANWEAHSEQVNLDCSLPNSISPTHKADKEDVLFTDEIAMCALDSIRSTKTAVIDDAVFFKEFTQALNLCDV